MSIERYLSNIAPLDREAMQAARARQEILTKPQGSLGRLEELSIQVAGITSQHAPKMKHKVALVMVGDHGVVEEGISAYPQAVTAQMVSNFLQGGAAINVLARQIGVRVVVVDIGVATELDPDPNLINKKIARGTNNITKGMAMTRAQALQSLIIGAEIIESEIEKGLDILATGEMGIGNTTPSSAIAALLTGQPVEKIVGFGTGINQEGLQRKIEVVQRALEVNRPNPGDGIDVLAKIGGFEIGGLAGAILAAGANRRPVVIDGFISTAAAMIAVSLAPQVRDYLIAAHTSQEQGHHLMMSWLGVKPLLDLQMRLGEGTGAVLAISLVEAACNLLNEMATFSEAGVSGKELS